MTNNIHRLKFILIAGLGSLALTACVPGQYGYETGQSGAGYGQYGTQADLYGAQQFGAQYGAGFTQSAYGAGFNQAANTGLRPTCNAQAAPCGFMRVVPVYPIYQVSVPQREPVVQIFDPPPPPPVAEIYEPEPIPYVEPDPVYEPVHHWPEPVTPVQSWKPIRK